MCWRPTAEVIASKSLITAAERCSVGKMLSIGKGLWAHIATGAKPAILTAGKIIPWQLKSVPWTPHVMLLPLPTGRETTIPKAQCQP